MPDLVALRASEEFRLTEDLTGGDRFFRRFAYYLLDPASEEARAMDENERKIAEFIVETANAPTIIKHMQTPDTNVSNFLENYKIVFSWFVGTLYQESKIDLDKKMNAYYDNRNCYFDWCQAILNSNKPLTLAVLQQVSDFVPKPKPKPVTHADFLRYFFSTGKGKAEESASVRNAHAASLLSSGTGISCAHTVCVVKEDEVDSLLQEHLGKGVKEIAFLGDHYVKITTPLKVSEGQVRVHVTRFEGVRSVANPDESRPSHLTVVAVDRVFMEKDKPAYRTTLYADVDQLLGLETKYREMAETWLANYLLGLPEEKRNDPIFVSGIHPKLSPVLLALIKVCATEAGKTLEFDFRDKTTSVVNSTLEAEVNAELGKLAGHAPPEKTEDVRPLFDLNGEDESSVTRRHRA